MSTGKLVAAGEGWGGAYSESLKQEPVALACRVASLTKQLYSQERIYDDPACVRESERIRTLTSRPFVGPSLLPTCCVLYVRLSCVRMRFNASFF